MTGMRKKAQLDDHPLAPTFLANFDEEIRRQNKTGFSEAFCNYSFIN
jgi:hypothetical protein